MPFICGQRGHSDYGRHGIAGWKKGYTSEIQSWGGFQRLEKLLVITDPSQDTTDRRDVIKWYHRFSAMDMPLPKQGYLAEVSFIYCSNE